MKTVIETATNISKYIFDDAHDLTMTATNITCPHFIIGDMNSTNATITEDVTPPEDWAGCKYTLDGNTWALNPDWVEPTDETDPE